MIRPALALGLMVALLAGCGTPFEQCLNRAGAELTRLETERAERQVNLARGYALIWRPRPAEICTDPDSGISAPCGGLFGGWDEEPAPINRAAEARRIALLDARIAEARPRAVAAQAACRAQFPQG